ncbi:MAG: class I SAM-dependent methyltransferase [Gammaproteobacteria bacterium]|nr:class I SAM-dependent methyltransferase [Gammaproteobacteria bacterium]
MKIKKLFKINLGRENKYNRDKWVVSSIESLAAGSKILDAGAGPQIYRKYCDHLVYVSQDFAKYDGGDLSGEVGMHDKEFHYEGLDIVSDITSIPEEDASFDAILCTEVLEHVPYPVHALTEFSRLLKPGGTLLLTAPFNSLTHFAPYFFCTGFSIYWYQYHLNKLGFELKEAIPNGNYYGVLAQEIERLPLIASRYSSSKSGVLFKFSSWVLKLALMKLNKSDKHSDEIQCYGYHVFAIKK